MIERIHLQILREVHRRGSLTAAAEVLFLTQPALSHAIKKLTQQAGADLWKKEGRHLRLTQAGEFLLREANRLLPQLERVDEVLTQFASGDKGLLRVGMECHPCYRWLLKVVNPFLQNWPGVEVDVKQRFQFGGMAALFCHDIDLLVTPDPLQKNGIVFTPVLAYEQVLVVAGHHRLAGRDFVQPEDLIEEILYTYPVDIERLDIYTEFLLPARCSPKKHKTLEATEMLLQLVAAGRGVAALPHWLVAEQPGELALASVRFGPSGIHKHIHLGMRQADQTLPFMQGFLDLAQGIR
jgi:LysR family transcriptional regulator, regulator for metE and metH